MNKTKCAPYELEHLDIRSIDSCYQFANFKKIGIPPPKLVPVTKAPRTLAATTTPAPVTESQGKLDRPLSMKGTKGLI